MPNTLKLSAIFPIIFETSSEIIQLEKTGLHSGNLGDIIYSLPTAFALGINHFVINVCADPAFGTRSINSDGAVSLAKLLLGQGSIKKVSVIQTQVPWEYANPKQIGIDYVLDTFRINWTEEKLHLIFRHALPFGIKVKASDPWIDTSQFSATYAKDIKKPYIVIGLTERYRRFGNDFYQQLLQDLPEDQLFFVGLESDLPEKRSIPGRYIKFDEIKDFAHFVANAALLIGNPSFPYALAEACKTKRLLEIPDNLNVHPLEETATALHLLSFDELRRRIFNALELPEQSVARLNLKIKELETQVGLLSEYQKTNFDLQEKFNLALDTQQNLQNLLDAKDREKQNLIHELEVLTNTANNLRQDLELTKNELLRTTQTAQEKLQLTETSLLVSEKKLLEISGQMQNLQELTSRYRHILESPLALFRRFLAEAMQQSSAGRSLHSYLAKSKKLKSLLGCE